MSKLQIMIVGTGGREKALEWKCKKSNLVERVFCISANTPFDTIVSDAKSENIGLVIIGPEAPLVAGLADYLRAEGIRVFGPSKAAALLEGSKAFAKEFCTKHGIPTAPYVVADTYEGAVAAIEQFAEPPVIKADGLCAGKGVFVSDTKIAASKAADNLLNNRLFGEAGSRIVIEERLHPKRGTGHGECSCIVISDGVHVIPFDPVRDFKRALEGDKGDNTGGMGAYAPYVLDGATRSDIQTRILMRTIDAMNAAGTPFMGALFAGIMLTEDGPMLVEFNSRFGSPETQVLLPRLHTDIVPYLLAATEYGGLAGFPALKMLDTTAVCTVVTSMKYPQESDDNISIPEHYIKETERGYGVQIFRAGTTGRLYDVVGCSLHREIARAKSQQGAQRIRAFDEKRMRFRRDIAAP